MPGKPSAYTPGLKAWLRGSPCTALPPVRRGYTSVPTSLLSPPSPRPPGSCTAQQFALGQLISTQTGGPPNRPQKCESSLQRNPRALDSAWRGSPQSPSLWYDKHPWRFPAARPHSETLRFKNNCSNRLLNQDCFSISLFFFSFSKLAPWGLRGDRNADFHKDAAMATRPAEPSPAAAGKPELFQEDCPRPAFRCTLWLLDLMGDKIAPVENSVLSPCPEPS